MFSKEQIMEIRKEFPYLQNVDKDIPLVYFDNAATTQKPEIIIKKLEDYYRHSNGNPHRGAHKLAMMATDVYEGSRERIAKSIGTKPQEVIFVRNATEGLNLVAYSLGLNKLKEGDSVVISLLEHHSNQVPWQRITKKKNAELKYLYPDYDMQITLDEVEAKVDENTKIFSITMASNVVATMPDVKKIIEIVRRKSNAYIVLDGAQFVPHHGVNVKDLDCDFMAFSGHKMLSAMGIGVLYGKEEILNEMEPFLYGGDMIEYVYEQDASFLPCPQRFEAGTPNVGGAKSLCDAFDYIEGLGVDNIFEYESYLTSYCYDKLKALDYLDVYTTSNKTRSPLVTFNFKGAHPHDVASILDSFGIAVRSGHHCAQPLHRYLKNNFSCRASFAFYNTTDEIDYFVKHLEDVKKIMGI